MQLIQMAQLRDAPEFICFPLTSSRMDPEGSPHSADEETATPDQIPKYQRSMRSLHMLATKFLVLLQEADGGVLDLKDVSDLTPV